MRKTFALATLVCVSALTLEAQPNHQKFVIFDAPGASSAAQSATYPLHGTMVADVNARGEVVGDFNDDANQVFQTFIRYPDGRIVVANDPSAGTQISSLTLQVGAIPYGLNDGGVVAGIGMNVNGQTYAMIRSANGTFTDFTGPQSVSWYKPTTRALSTAVARQREITSTIRLRTTDTSVIPMER